jgi:hypothetical protein
MAAGKVGGTSWSAGLTAATDPRVAAVAAKLRGRKRGQYKWATPRGESCPVLPIERARQADYAYVLGMYLGDGHIAKGRSAKLRIFLDNAHPEIVSRCATTMARVNPFHKVGTQLQEPSMTVVRSYGLCWLRLLPQHGPGRKHKRAIVLENWQREIVIAEPMSFLRGLIESDGCRFDRLVGGKLYGAYEFTNLSTDIIGLFTWTCDLLGLRYSRPSQMDVSIARRREVSLLDDFIGPKH